MRILNRRGRLTAVALGIATLAIAWSASAAPVSGTNVLYTTTADFGQGTAVNVSTAGDKVELAETTSTFPFIWIAASNRGTILKLDTVTGAILGEYRTGPDTLGYTDPSRTTVSLNGSVWAGNRQRGSIVHVGLEEASQCIDRNGNGVIDTSSGYDDVKPWPDTGAVDSSNGGVDTAQDECILHFVPTSTLYPGGDARHITVDSNNDVWVSGVSDRVFKKIDGATGAVLRTEGPFPCGAYGGLIDSSGVLWSTTQGSLLRYDPAQPISATNPQCLGYPLYGLAIDPSGNIWGTVLFGGTVYKIAPNGSLIGTFPQGFSSAQGLAVDGNGDVWVSSSLFSGTVVSHLKNNGAFVGNVSISPSNGPTGIAVDAAGKVWAANINSSDTVRIDPALGAIGADAVTPIGAVDLRVPFPATATRPSANPYNYSDMTGNVALGTTAPQGTWTVVQDSGAAGTVWGKITWNTEAAGTVPAGATLKIEARTAETEAGLGGAAYTEVSNGTPFSMSGRYIQVRATLLPNDTGDSPVLSDIRVQTAAPSDTTKPSCFISAKIAGPPTQLQVTVRDQGSGLASIVVTKSQNADTVVPPFTVGTTDPVVVTATKINQSQGSVIELRVTDVAGNVTVCDPVVTLSVREAGKPATETYSGLPQAESKITIVNGDPGVNRLDVTVNGRTWRLTGLKPNQEVSLDVAAAMRPGNENTITLAAHGKPSGSVLVVISD